MTKKRTVEDVQVAKDFVHEIEVVMRDKKLDVLEAVLYYCEQTGLEIESAASFIKHNSKMKHRLEQVARQQKLLKNK